MNTAIQGILIDTCNLVLLLLAIGLPVYGALRHRRAGELLDRGGNVWTDPFNWLDVLIVLAFVLGARAMAAAYQGPGELSSYTAAGILKGSLLFVMVAAMIVMMFQMRRVAPSELFGLDRLRMTPLLVWVAAGGIAAILTAQLAALLWQRFVLGPVWQAADEQALVTLLRSSPDLGLRLAIVLTACLIQPLTEELIFRGYIYPSLKRFASPGFAALASSLLFAVLHLHVPGLGPLFLLGLLLVLAYELSGTLWVPAGMHAVFNTSTVLYQLLHS